jgi:hypothetical protein
MIKYCTHDHHPTHPRLTVISSGRLPMACHRMHSMYTPISHAGPYCLTMPPVGRVTNPSPTRYSLLLTFYPVVHCVTCYIACSNRHGGCVCLWDETKMRPVDATSITIIPEVVTYDLNEVADQLRGVRSLPIMGLINEYDFLRMLQGLYQRLGISHNKRSANTRYWESESMNLTICRALLP